MEVTRWCRCQNEEKHTKTSKIHNFWTDHFILANQISLNYGKQSYFFFIEREHPAWVRTCLSFRMRMRECESKIVCWFISQWKAKRTKWERKKNKNNWTAWRHFKGPIDHMVLSTHHRMWHDEDDALLKCCGGQK